MEKLHLTPANAHTTAHTIFLTFYMKSECLKGQKVIKLNFSGKPSFWGKIKKKTL